MTGVLTHRRQPRRQRNAYLSNTNSPTRRDGREPARKGLDSKPLGSGHGDPSEWDGMGLMRPVGETRPNPARKEAGCGSRNKLSGSTDGRAVGRAGFSPKSGGMRNRSSHLTSEEELVVFVQVVVVVFGGVGRGGEKSTG